MKKALILVLVVTSITAMPAACVFASDYQGDEKPKNVFQVLGDMITGNYKVDGKPIKDKGVFQIAADETQKMKFASEESKEKGK